MTRSKRTKGGSKTSGRTPDVIEIKSAKAKAAVRERAQLRKTQMAFQQRKDDAAQVDRDLELHGVAVWPSPIDRALEKHGFVMIKHMIGRRPEAQQGMAHVAVAAAPAQLLPGVATRAVALVALEAGAVSVAAVQNLQHTIDALHADVRRLSAEVTLLRTTARSIPAPRGT